jgi:hypothetical protein
VRSLGRRNNDPELVMLAAGLCAGLMVVLVAGMATDYLITEVQFWLFALLVSAMRLLMPVSRPASNLSPAAAPMQRLTPGALRHEGRRDRA